MNDNSVRPAQSQPRQPGREGPMVPEPDYRPRYPGSGRLAEKVALVTGGDSGIGRAVSLLFAREGAKIAVVYLEEESDAAETKELIEVEGSACLLIRGDIAEPSFCHDAAKRTVERFGRLDILVNNAAEQHPRDEPEEISPEQLQETFQTNVFGYLYMTQAALLHLGAGARIINTTSVTAYRGSSHLIDYSATRGAIVSLTRSLAKALQDRGIRVNAVAPGPIWTPLIPASFSAEEVESFGTQAPLGRAGQPNEVAPSHLFLACEDSSYMNGQVLHPNGGEIVGG